MRTGGNCRTVDREISGSRPRNFCTCQVLRPRRAVRTLRWCVRGGWGFLLPRLEKLRSSQPASAGSPIQNENQKWLLETGRQNNVSLPTSAHGDHINELPRV